MDIVEFTELAMQWRRLRKNMEEIEDRMFAYVAQKEASQIVADVHITYTKPRKTYDYAGAAKNAEFYEGDPIVTRHTSSKVDWRKVCTEANLVVSGEFVTVAKQPSIKIKLKS